MNKISQIGLVTLLLVVNLVIYSKLFQEFGVGEKGGLISIISSQSQWSFNFLEDKLGISTHNKFENSKLIPLVGRVLDGKSGDFYIYIESLVGEEKDHQGLAVREEEVVPSASLYKLFLMAAALKQVEKGNLKLDSQISASQSHLQDVLGGKEFGYEDIDSETIAYSLDEILTRIATISDNYAAIMLAEKIGWDRVQDLAEEIGAHKTTIKSPISTSAYDVAILLKRIYQKDFLSPESSEMMLNYLSKSKINNRIPAKLPKDLKIAHKTGELSRIRHDAGIVFLEGRPYLIVLMSQNLVGEDDGVETLAEVSKEVYDYFNSPVGKVQ